MKKIVVTGATSMIGVALIEVCLKHNIEVHAIIRPGTNRQDRIIKDDNVHYHLSSLDDLLNIQDLPSDCDVFYHFAWAGTDRIQRDDPEVQSQNIKYALDSVKLAKKCGCSKYIGAGSQAEYGPCASVIDEILFIILLQHMALLNMQPLFFAKNCVSNLIWLMGSSIN